MSPFSLPAVSEPPKIALEGCPERPRRLTRAHRELPKPLWSVCERPPEHPQSALGAPNASNRASASSQRPSGSSKVPLRRVPGLDFRSFLAFYLDLHSFSFFNAAPERQLPGGGGESPQASSIENPPPPGRRVQTSKQISTDSAEVCDLRCNTRQPADVLPAIPGHPWSNFLTQKAPKTSYCCQDGHLGRPGATSFFWTLIFGRFGSLFLRSGLILETSASQKPMFS